MADQLRADCVGSYGNRVIQTPNLDRLAREGVTFTSCVLLCPELHARAVGAAHWTVAMAPRDARDDAHGRELSARKASRSCRSRLLRRGDRQEHFHPIRNRTAIIRCCSMSTACPGTNGRMSVATTKHGFGHRCRRAIRMPPGLSWNDFRGKAFALPERLHATTWTGDTAVNFLQTYERPEPFFLKVSFIRPHSPYDPPARWMKKYESAEIPPRSRASGRSGTFREVITGPIFGMAKYHRKSRGNRARLTTVP